MSAHPARRSRLVVIAKDRRNVLSESDHSHTKSVLFDDKIMFEMKNTGLLGAGWEDAR